MTSMASTGEALVCDVEKVIFYEDRMAKRERLAVFAGQMRGSSLGT